jgi:hypothetical protein
MPRSPVTTTPAAPPAADPLEKLLRDAESAPPAVAAWLKALRRDGEHADSNDLTNTDLLTH